MTGQLNMFDFFHSIDESETGEVEMVSLMPNFEEEAEPKVEPEPESVTKEEPVRAIKTTQVSAKNDTVVMTRTYEVDGEQVEVSYLNYNKVRVVKGNAVPIIHEFDNSKEAVDFYVQYMQAVKHEG